MLKFVDLFCGGGYGARGAVRGGGEPLMALDGWKLATDTYRANFPSAHVINDLIENVDPYVLAKKFKPDVLLTSPECTAHSIARGSKPGSEHSRETALGIVGWIESMKPKWVIVENVNRMKKWDRHDELVQTIEGLDYRVNDLYLNSADFGSPQARKRMFLICSREGFSVSREDLLRTMRRKPKSAHDVINWNAAYPVQPLYKAGRAQATLERAERAIAAIGKNKPFLIVYYGSDYAGGWQTLDAPLRTVTTIDRFGLVTWKAGQPFLRMLQPDELMQAMGAGKDHKMPVGSRREKVKLCGNGVCSDVLEAIFKRITQLQSAQKGRAA